MTSAAGAWPAPRRGSAILLGVSLAWLAWMLWSANAILLGATDTLIAVAAAAAALPVIIAVTLLAGLATGLCALVWRPVRAALRWPLAIAAGTVVGAVTAGLIIWGYGYRAAIVLLAISVLVAGTLGGALSAIRPGRVVFVGGVGALGVFVVDAVLDLFASQLMHLFGAGHTVSSLLAAASRLALTTSLLGGLIAGGIAFWLLYRARCGWTFPAYLGAGGTPGILLLLADLITRIGGAQLYNVVGRFGPADQTYLDYVAQSRLNHGLIVMFVGAIVALLCLGSTMRRPETTKQREAVS